MKKLLTFVLAAVFCVTLVAAVGCTPVNDGETYNGALSESAYSSKDNAIEAFLENEISGQAIVAQLVKYSKEKDLTEGEIAVLGLKEEDVANVLNVEKGSVEYSEHNTNVAPESEEKATKSYSKTLYILQYGETFKYFTPALAVGESLTASYFASVFDVKNYLNCTQETNMSVAVKGGGASITIETDIFAKISETAFYTKMSIMGQNAETYAWSVEEDKINIATKTDSVWKTQTVSNMYENISDLISNAPQDAFGNFDYSFFEKTKDGFALRKDKVNEWLETYFESMGDMLPDGTVDFKKNFDISYNVVVKGGRVVKTDISAAFVVASDTSEINVTLTGTGEYKDFGTTQVTVPNEIKQLIK